MADDGGVGGARVAAAREFTPYGAARVTGELERRIPYPRLDAEFYRRVAASDRTRVLEEVLIPAEAGVAVRVAAGQVARVLGPEGPQIADIDFFNADDV